MKNETKLEDAFLIAMLMTAAIMGIILSSIMYQVYKNGIPVRQPPVEEKMIEDELDFFSIEGINEA